MTESARQPDARVRALWRRVVLDLGLAAAGGLLAVLGGLGLAGWLAAASPAWRRPSALPILLWLAAATLAGVWLWRLAHRARRWSRHAAAAEIERRVGLSLGSVRGAVEPGLQGPGTSRALVQLHRARVAERLEGRRTSELGDAEARAARSRATVAVVLAAGLLIASATVWVAARESASRAWAAVLHPVRQLDAPPLPALRITAGAERVRRGRDLPVFVEAPGRDSVLLAWQPRGDPASRRWYPVSDGVASAVVRRLETATRVWARAPDGAVSDTLRVAPYDPLLLIDVQVDLRFPPHTRREREVLSAPLPVMSVLEGTRAMVRATTTRPVERAALRSASGATIPFDIVSGERRFRRSFGVRSGTWGWDLVGPAGAPLEGEPDSLRFLTVPDSAPRVEVVYPGVDTLLSTEMRQPLLIDVRDDYGLSRVELVSWRVSAWGESWPERVEPVELEGDAPRASLPALIDARGRGFLPGDTLRYFVRAYDNAPDPHVGQSREFVLRLPTLDEIRERAIVESRELLESAEALAERARRQEQATRALERSSRTQPAPGTFQNRGAENSVEFRDTETTRRALDEASELLQESRDVQESLRELQEAIEAAGLNDTTVLERLREIEALYQRILTPELREQIEALREALAQLDPQQIREAIRQLSEGSADFRQRVEQAIELLRRAALEQEFATLETQAEELAEAHEQLADAVIATEPRPDSAAAAALARRASDLAERAGRLSERSEALAGELTEAGENEAAEQATAATRSAGEASRSDQQVAASLSDRPQRAGRPARGAAIQMRQAATALREGREGMQQNWRQEVVQALERTQTEALELARRQQELTESIGSTIPAERVRARSEEAALKRGVDQMREALDETARESLLVDPRLTNKAGDIAEMMQKLLAQMGDGTRQSAGDPRISAEVAEALNDLAYRSMQAGENAGGASSGTGLQEALEQLARLAERQGELNAQAGGMTPGAAADAVLQQLAELAARQRAIGQQLEGLSRELGPRGQVLGRIDELGREAEELARELERGRIDTEIVERQNRLYNRLLDAGRTLERDEFERERRAERPGRIEIVRPGELPNELLEGPRYPLPDSETLNRYPPALRRLILEYFDRLNRRGSADGS